MQQIKEEKLNKHQTPHKYVHIGEKLNPKYIFSKFDN